MKGLEDPRLVDQVDDVEVEGIGDIVEVLEEPVLQTRLVVIQRDEEEGQYRVVLGSTHEQEVYHDKTCKGNPISQPACQVLGVVEDQDVEDAREAVVRVEEDGCDHGDDRCEQGDEGEFLSLGVDDIYGKKPEEKGEEDILVGELESSEESVVERELGNEREGKKPRKVLLDIPGMGVSLDEEETVQGERDPSDDPEEMIFGIEHGSGMVYDHGDECDGPQDK